MFFLVKITINEADTFLKKRMNFKLNLFIYVSYNIHKAHER